MKLVAFLAQKIPAFREKAEQGAYAVLEEMAENHRNSPRYWYTHRSDLRISAFYKDYATYEAIPDWGMDMPNLDPDAAWKRLDHGYDEEKEQLDLSDLQSAAQFRGGECQSDSWDGDLYTPLDWACVFGHTFTAHPFTILNAGHWCPRCDTTWHGDEQAKKNPFFAQVWYADHDSSESNFYPVDCFQDIQDADKDWENFQKEK